MNWPVGAILGLVSIIGITASTGWMLVTGLKRGVTYSHRVAYSRVTDPSNFWFYTIAYAVVFLSTAGLLAYFAINLVFSG